MKQQTQSPWQKGNMVEPVVFRAVTYTGKKFIGVGDSGKIGVGDSPTTLAFVNSGLNENQHLFSVASGNNITVALGRDGVGVRSDENGQKWTPINIGKIPPAVEGRVPDINSVTWTGTQFVCVWETGGISSSTDGVNWTYFLDDDGKLRGSLRCIAFINNQVMIGTANGHLIKTSDLVNWEKYRVDAGGIRAMTYSAKLKMLVVVGHNISVSTDPALKKWQTTYIRPAGDGNVLMSVAAVGEKEKVYAAGDGGKCLVSSDGKNWVIVPTDSLKHWLGFAQSPQYLVSVGNGGPKNNNPQYTHSIHYLPIDDGGGDDGGGGGTVPTEPGSDVQQMLKDALKKNDEARVLIQNALALVTTGRDKPARKKK